VSSRAEESDTRRPLWRCSRCGARFTTRNQQHSCGVFDIDALFAGRDPIVRRLFDRFVEVARASGPLTVVPQRSRIALQVRMRFAALMPQKSALRGHLVLARRCRSARFQRIDTYSPRNHVHVFRLTSDKDFDDDFCRLIAEACKVGRQEHLRR